MCCCQGYGFQTVKSEIGYTMKSESMAHFPEFLRKLINWLKILVYIKKTGTPIQKNEIGKFKYIAIQFNSKESIARCVSSKIATLRSEGFWEFCECG